MSMAIWSNPAARRRWGFWLMAIPFIGFFAARFWIDAGENLSLALGLAAIVALTPGTYLYWTGLDELAKDAQRQAWFWGGGLGLLAGLLGAIAVPQVFPASPLIETLRATPGDEALALGAAYAALATFAGFCVWWVGFWLMKR